MLNVFDLLDREWQQLKADRGAARRLTHICQLTGARTLADLETHVRAATPEQADSVLLALVTRVIDHDDQLAARVLLQLLLPGTRNLARRWWALGDHDERAAAAVSAVYDRIRTYPLTRRPGRIAANVLLDAARQLRRSVPRLTTHPTPDVHLHDRDITTTAQTHSSVELADALTDAVDDGIIDLRDARLIAQSRIAGHRIADIAAHHHIGARTLWDRRHRAEQRLTARPQAEAVSA
jgi:DNA-directed RNA polymerase specialized sigma24 family protein